MSGLQILAVIGHVEALEPHALFADGVRYCRHRLGVLPMVVRHHYAPRNGRPNSPYQDGLGFRHAARQIDVANHL